MFCPEESIARMIRASAAAREAMIQEQIAARGIRDAAVLAALRAVPRELFVPEAYADEAYADRALPIGPAQTISQPFIVAYMTSQLEVASMHRVLEIGTGSGYQCAVLAHLAGQVDTIEWDAGLNREAEARLAALGITTVRFHVGDGGLGLPDSAPFDRVIVTAACPHVPIQLVNQLAEGGVLIAPVGESEVQSLVRVTRRSRGHQEQWLLPCRFVKLRGAHGWPD